MKTRPPSPRGRAARLSGDHTPTRAARHPGPAGEAPLERPAREHGVVAGQAEAHRSPSAAERRGADRDPWESGSRPESDHGCGGSTFTLVRSTTALRSSAAGLAGQQLRGLGSSTRHRPAGSRAREVQRTTRARSRSAKAIRRRARAEARTIRERYARARTARPSNDAASTGQVACVLANGATFLAQSATRSSSC